MSATNLAAAFETLVGAASEHLVQLLDPLQAELLVSEIGAAWSDDAADKHAQGPDVVIGDAFIAYAERCASPGALAILRGLAVLGSDRQRPLAAAAADRLAADGVPEPAWADQLDGVWLTGCWACSDVYGDQTAVLVGFERAGERHSLVVLVEHNMGEIATDAFIGGDPDQVLANLAEGPLGWCRQLGPAEARGMVERALLATDMTPEAPLGKTYHATRALAFARLRTLPPAQPPPRQPNAVQRARIIADFVISPYGTTLADQDAAIRCAEFIVAHSCAFDQGRLLRVSPMKTQIFLLAWVPLKTVLTDRERDALPEVMTAWTRWAGQRGELPDDARDKLDDAVADLGAKFPAVYANPPRDPEVEAAKPPGGQLPDADELRAMLARRSFALPYSGSRIGDTDYPQLNPTDEHERWLLILGEHPEYHQLLAGTEDLGTAQSVEELFPQLHLDTHDIVVTQLWNDAPPEAWQAAQRLTETGMERHDVLHAICDVVTFHLLAGLTAQDLAHNEAYRKDLDVLGRPTP